MQTFKDYTYERPNIKKEKETFDDLLKNFTDASSIQHQNEAIGQINAFRNRLSTLSNLVYIRASINTNDDYYQNERDFFDEIEPEIQELNTRFYKELVKSPFRDELEKQWDGQLFQIAEHEIRAFSRDVITLLQKENKLSLQYSRLIASAEVEFQGETYTLAQLSPFAQSKDRSIRKQAIEASAGFFAEHADEFDNIYDQLVKTRHEIATTLGYKNFVELGYIRMQRIDYDANMVETFRKQVRESIVPLVSKLYKKQPERIGVDSLKYYDESFEFATGNATPKGSPEWIIENGKKMYEELSPETKEFCHKITV